MRIGVVGPQYPDAFADNLISSAARMGHETVALGSPYPRPMSNVVLVALELARKVEHMNLWFQDRVVRRAQDLDLDLIISVDSSLVAESVRAMKSGGAKVALWFPDAVGNLGRHAMFLAPYDGIFLKQPRLVERARQLLESAVYYLPEACNPAWHFPPQESPRLTHIVIAGNMYPFRVRLLERLNAEGFPLKIFGPPWPRWLRSPELQRCWVDHQIAREEKAYEYRSAAAVINTFHPAETDGVNCRLFEAAGCGGAVLTEWRPEIAHFFKPDEEMLVYSTFGELVDGARRLLNNTVDGRMMGDAAAARAHKEHTYEHRLGEMFDTLGC